MTELPVLDLGRLGYAAALARQLEVHAAVLARSAAPTLILVEHDPVITVSRRGTAVKHLLADPATLARLGINVQPTDRGGDITYHGPGQLVAYPILHLDDLGLNVGGYMRFLEQVVIDTVAAFGVSAFRDPPHTGVWVGEGVRRQESEARSQKKNEMEPASPGTSPSGGRVPGVPAKLCALGVRVRRNVTLHGLALNVSTDLSHFQTIVPCGLPDRGVTSLREILGDQAPSMRQVKEELIGSMRRATYAQAR